MRKAVGLVVGLMAAAVVGLAALVYKWSVTPYGRMHPYMGILLKLSGLLDVHEWNDDTLPEVRQKLDWVIPRISVAAVEDRVIEGRHGPFPVRIYSPEGAGPFPVLVYYHGGGFAAGSIQSHENITRHLARDTGAVVVSVGYHLAPEHPFPAAVDDAYTAAQWAAANADSFNGDAARFVVGGDSAGGNLAAAVCLKARDEGGPQIGLQLLLYAATILTNVETESWRQFDGYILSGKMGQQIRAWYLPDERDAASPYASPLNAPDCAGLPPAYIMTAEFDPLLDDGVLYASRLRQAGVPVTYRMYEGMLHGFLSFEDFVALVPGALCFYPQPGMVYADIRAAMQKTFA